MADHAVRLEGVELRGAEGGVILRDLCWELPHAGVGVVLGASGSGKSRLLRLINRLDEPSAGRVEVLGRPQAAWDVGELRRRVGWVPQRPALSVGTSRDNLAVPVRLRVLSEDELRARTPAALEVAGVDPSLLQRPASQLSGGERHRIALARALLLDPAILLLDEPTAALHGAAAAALLERLERWRRERSATLLVVTHRIEDVRRLGGQAIVLAQGRIRRRGGTEELLADPEVFHLLTGQVSEPAS